MKRYKIASFLIAVISLLLLCSCSNNNEIEHIDETTSQEAVETTDGIFNESDSVIYDEAIDNLNNGNLSNARELFVYLGDYQKATTYVELIDFITDICGDYYFERVAGLKYTFQISKDSVKVRNYDNSRSTNYTTITFSPDEEYGFKMVAKDGYGTYIFVKKDGSVYYRSIGDTFTNTDSYDESEFGKLYLYANGYIEPKEPAIGMTVDEVVNSTWGKPQKINKTTTKYGIHEQWVYSSGKYIYFDDGIVTSIQE